jgi:hypothetical protein
MSKRTSLSPGSGRPGLPLPSTQYRKMAKREAILGEYNDIGLLILSIAVSPLIHIGNIVVDVPYQLIMG